MRARWIFWAVPNPTAWVRTGTQTSLFHVHQWWERCGADLASGGLSVGRRACPCHETPPMHQLFSCLLRAAAEDCVWGWCEQEEQRQDLSPEALRGGEWPCLQGVTNNRGGSGPYIAISGTVTQVSLYSQCRKTKRIICPTYLRSLVQGEVHCTVQVGQVSPTGGCHLAVQAFSPGMDWLSEETGPNLLRVGVSEFPLCSGISSGHLHLPSPDLTRTPTPYHASPPPRSRECGAPFPRELFSLSKLWALHESAIF